LGREILSLPPPPYDHRIEYGAGPFHFGYLRLPKSKGPHPVVVVIHGGFWRAAFDLEHSGHLCAALTRAGLATWSLEYRRIGNPGGAWPGTFEDVRQGAAHLLQAGSQYGLDLSRAVAIGHSAGGHLALWLGAEKPLRWRGVISLAGVADLRRAWELKLSNTVVADLLGGTPTDHPERYARASPLERLPLRVPTRLLHGDRDDIVPLEISQRFAAAAQRAGDDVVLTPLAGADHFDVIDPRSAVWSEVERSVLALI
jgi:dipeptidyl aminopeptidase/acylaminoacyl peptidase